jgi:hypothetical protein
MIQTMKFVENIKSNRGFVLLALGVYGGILALLILSM